jgi:hypothetical protein
MDHFRQQNDFEAILQYDCDHGEAARRRDEPEQDADHVAYRARRLLIDTGRPPAARSEPCERRR